MHGDFQFFRAFGIFLAAFTQSQAVQRAFVRLPLQKQVMVDGIARRGIDQGKSLHLKLRVQA